MSFKGFNKVNPFLTYSSASSTSSKSFLAVRYDGIENSRQVIADYLMDNRIVRGYGMSFSNGHFSLTRKSGVTINVEEGQWIIVRAHGLVEAVDHDKFKNRYRLHAWVEKFAEAA
jgi:hypothetical protein